MVPSRVDQFRRSWPKLTLALLSVLYFVPTCVRAARTKLWYDEILTFDAAALLPSVHSFWTFLTHFEASPPLGFLLAAASEGIFGKSEFALRLPSVIAFWIMAMCLYAYLGRRIPKTFAIAAMLLAALTAAGRYSYEARPYALMLALGGIGLVAWQAAAEGRRRRVALVVLAVALAAALCSHSMAVTLALPFLAGEATRTWQRKRVDWPVWCAFAASAPAAVVIPIIKHGRDFTGMAPFTGSIMGHIALTFVQMLRPAIAPLGLAFALVLFLRSYGDKTTGRDAGMPAYELAALAGFAMIPFVAVPMSLLGGRYWLRYSLNCTIGLAGLLVVLLFLIGQSNRMSGVTVLVVVAVSFAVGQFYPEDNRPDGGLKEVNTSEEIRTLAERIPADVPLVISQGTTFVELEHYATPQLAKRLYYLTAPSVAAAIDGDLLFEVSGARLGEYFPFRAHFEDYHAFIAKHSRFYAIQPIRNIAREYFAGRLTMQIKEMSDHQQYFEFSTVASAAAR